MDYNSIIFQQKQTVPFKGGNTSGPSIAKQGYSIKSAKNAQL